MSISRVKLTYNDLAMVSLWKNPQRFSEVYENKQLLKAIVVRSCFYSDLCTSISISTINSGSANSFTPTQEPVGKWFL